MNKLVVEWVRFAYMDLAQAKNSYDTMHPKPIEGICFHCQQAAEKMLKAYLVSKGLRV